MTINLRARFPVGIAAGDSPARLRDARRRHAARQRAGRTSGHHDAHRLQALRSECRGMHPAARPREGARLRAGQRARVHAGRRPRAGNGRQGSRAGISPGARQQRCGQDGRAGAAPPRLQGRRHRRRAGRSGVAEPQPPGGDVGRRLCRHHRSAAGDVAPQRAAIRDRQAPCRRRGRLHQRQARRQGQRGAPDPGPDRVPGAALRRPSATRSRRCRASPSSPTSRPTRSTRRAASRR